MDESSGIEYNHGMNTKKAVWIGRPEKLRTTLHSFSFEPDGSSSVFFTAGEDGSIDLKKSGSAESAFMLLHTPSDYVLFRKSSISLVFSGIKAEIPAISGDHVILEKKGRKLTFTDGEKTILELEKDAFSGSASFGIVTEGPGTMSIEVF